MTRPADWREQLLALAFRFSGYGVCPDLAALTVAESWGLFLFLRQASGAPHG